MAIAVAPMTNPMSALRAKPLETDLRTIDAGCCSNVVATHATKTYDPSSPTSIRYSGQWRRKLAVALSPSERRSLVLTILDPTDGEILSRGLEWPDDCSRLSQDRIEPSGGGRVLPRRVPGFSCRSQEICFPGLAGRGVRKSDAYARAAVGVCGGGP